MVSALFSLRMLLNGTQNGGSGQPRPGARPSHEQATEAAGMHWQLQKARAPPSRRLLGRGAVAPGVRADDGSAQLRVPLAIHTGHDVAMLDVVG